MAEPRVVEIPGVGNVEFPDSMSEADVNTASAKLYGDAKAGKSVVEPNPGKSIVGQLADRVKSDAQSIADAPGVGGKLSAAADVAGNFNKDSAIGLAKGAGSTAYTLTSLANKGIRKLESLNPAVKQEDVDKYIPAMNPELPDFLKPRNPVQSLGKGEEQALEFFLPAGAVSKGSKAIEAGAKVLPKFLQGAARVGGQAALEGGANAAVAKAQGGEAAPAFFLGAGGKLGGEAAGAAAPFLKKSAQNTYAKFLNPTKEATKFEAKAVVPELLNRRQLAISGQGLEDRAAANLNATGSQIDAAVKKIPASNRPNVQNVLDAIDQHKQSFLTNGVPVGSTAEAAVKNSDRARDTILDIVTAPGGAVTHQSLNRARQILDKAVAKSGAYTGKSLSEGAALDADKAAANAIRSEFARGNPDIATLNKEYHFWSQVKDVIGETNDRRIGQQGGLGRVLAPLVGISGGLAHGGASAGGAADAAIYTTALLAAHEAIKSPAWKTLSAVGKNEMATAFASGNFKKVTQIAGRIASAGASAATSRRSGKTPSTAPAGQAKQ
jgi:hypothetical protein